MSSCHNQTLPWGFFPRFLTCPKHPSAGEPCVAVSYLFAFTDTCNVSCVCNYTNGKIYTAPYETRSATCRSSAVCLPCTPEFLFACTFHLPLVLYISNPITNQLTPWGRITGHPPSHYRVRKSPWFHHSNNTWWSVQVTKLPIMQCSSASCHFIS